jgi:hypothetical protein
MGALGDAFSLYKRFHPLGFSKGGRISMFAGINPKFARGADSIARPSFVDADRALGMGDLPPFRRGGRIMKGSAAMKKKMAKLRAMKKRRV